MNIIKVFNKINIILLNYFSRLTDSNHRPKELQSSALPAELKRVIKVIIYLYILYTLFVFKLFFYNILIKYSGS